MLRIDHFYIIAYTCFRPTAVAVILVNRELSIYNVFFSKNLIVRLIFSIAELIKLTLNFVYEKKGIYTH